jgi:hypothetical protein
MTLSRFKNRLLLAFATVAVVFAAIVIWFAVAAKRTSNALVSSLDTPGIAIAMKGELGRVMFGEVQVQGAQTIQGAGLDALLKPSKPMRSEGLISAYRRDPATFKHYAELFETAIHALHVGKVVDVDRTAYKFPMLSSELPLELSETLDAWHHPYCVSTVQNQIVVVNGGASVRSYSCASQKVTAKQVASASRSVFETAAGEVVVLVDDKRLDAASGEPTR